MLSMVLLSVMLTVASWYGDAFHGNTMANGEPYNMYAMTAASTEHALGTELIVRHENQSVVVEITDRGPYCFEALADGYLVPHPTRGIDLSKGAFAKLALLSSGLIEVEVRYALPMLWKSPPDTEWYE